MHRALCRSLHVLRFLNLLEPGDGPVLSITKIAMWVSVAGLAVHLFLGSAVDVASAVGFFTSASLYAWRRFVFWKTGHPPHDGDQFEPPPLAGQ